MQLSHPVAGTFPESGSKPFLNGFLRLLLALATALCLRARGAAPVVLYGVGDLPGGIVFSEVRDATKAGGVIYAVGNSAARNGSTGGDTAILWNSTGGLVALANLVQNDLATTFTTASAITPDAAFIASRARSVAVGGVRLAVRVTRNGMVNLNLGNVAGISGNSAATAISADGSILYGLGDNNGRAFRFTADGPTATPIPFLDASDTGSLPAPRGTSADGSVMVGTSYGATSERAFRYVHGAGVSALPLLPGGTWSEATAVSPDGNLTLLNGNSRRLPAGEVYRHDARNGSVTRLGLANEGWRPLGAAGMTADGALIAVTVQPPDTDGPSYACFHNRNGWFHLHSAVAAGGLDLLAAGWSLDVIFGLSADGTLAFGRGSHNGNQEGFVVEFPAGFLAEFGSTRESPANPTIVGSWTFGAEGTVIMFLPDGTFLEMENAGLERGTCSWDPASGALELVTQLDTNGDLGPSGVNGAVGMTFKISADTGTVHIPGDGSGDLLLTRVKSQPGSLAGGWLLDDRYDGFIEVVIFLPDGTYIPAQANAPAAQVVEGYRQDGMEEGTYTWNPATGALVAHPVIDTDGEEDGLSSISPAAKIFLTPNQVSFTYQDGADTGAVPRVSEVRLVASANGAGVTLAWPAHLTDYSVQVNATGPAASNWQPVPGTPTVEGGMLRLPVVPSGAQQWFRLFKP